MSGSPIVMAFRDISTGHLPDVHQLDARQQVLWILTATKAHSSIGALTGGQLAGILSDSCGIALPRQRVLAILEKERVLGTVARVRVNGRAHFKIMHRGEEEILRSAAKSIFIEPATALTSIRAVEEVLRSLKGNIRVCDTYIDSRTLDYLAQVEKATSIQLLTENVQDSGRLKRDLAAFEREHPIPIELRVAPLGQLHDRYVLHADGILLVGASLKDIGKKQSMIVALSPSLACENGRAFGRCWSNATKFH